MIPRIKIFNALVFTLLLLCTLLLFSYFYSAYLEEPYLSYKEMPFAVPSPVYAGGPAVSHVVRCNSTKTTKQYTTTRGFQKMGGNQPPIILPSIDLSLEPGCEPAISRINIVPDGTVPGYYRFVGVASVQGLLSWHQVPWGTDFFQVIAKPVKDTEIIVHTENKEVKIEMLP